MPRLRRSVRKTTVRLAKKFLSFLYSLRIKTQKQNGKYILIRLNYKKNRINVCRNLARLDDDDVSSGRRGNALQLHVHTHQCRGLSDVDEFHVVCVIPYILYIGAYMMSLNRRLYIPTGFFHHI